MKALIFTLVLIMGVFTTKGANASGCGGPEYYWVSQDTLKQYPWSKVGNFSVYITEDSNGGRSIKLHLYTEVMQVPEVPALHWHTLKLSERGPELSPVELKALIAKSGVLAKVRDHYEVDCASYQKATAENLQVMLEHQGIKYEFKTYYDPKAE